MKTKKVTISLTPEQQEKAKKAARMSAGGFNLQTLIREINLFVLFLWLGN